MTTASARTLRPRADRRKIANPPRAGTNWRLPINLRLPWRGRQAGRRAWSLNHEAPRSMGTARRTCTGIRPPSPTSHPGPGFPPTNRPVRAPRSEPTGRRSGRKRRLCALMRAPWLVSSANLLEWHDFRDSMDYRIASDFQHPHVQYAAIVSLVSILFAKVKASVGASGCSQGWLSQGSASHPLTLEDDLTVILDSPTLTKRTFTAHCTSCINN